MFSLFSLAFFFLFFLPPKIHPLARYKGDAVDNESLETAFADAVNIIDFINEKKQAAYLAANPQSAPYFESMMDGGQPQVVSTQPAMMTTGVAGQKAGMLAAMSAPPAYTNPYAEDATPDDPFAMHPFLSSVPEQGVPEQSMIVQAPTGTMMSVAIPEGAVPGDQLIVTTGDGQADLFRKAVLIDTDGDGVFDTAQFK